MNYKELLQFIKYLRDCFEGLKIKPSLVYLYLRFHLLCTKLSNNMVKILKEEFSEERL